MFSAIGNLGAGGLQDVQLSDVANSVLYATFFGVGFVAGSINVRVLLYNTSLVDKCCHISRSTWRNQSVTMERIGNALYAD